MELPVLKEIPATPWGNKTAPIPIVSSLPSQISRVEASERRKSAQFIRTASRLPKVIIEAPIPSSSLEEINHQKDCSNQLAYEALSLRIGGVKEGGVIPVITEEEKLRESFEWELV